VDAAIVTEPTSLRVCLAHKDLWIEVETTGRAAHGSNSSKYRRQHALGRFLAELDQLERELRADRDTRWSVRPSLHAAMIQGGSGQVLMPRVATTDRTSHRAR